LKSPRLGFVGVGRIGARRLQAIMTEDTAEVAGVYDPNPANVQALLSATGLNEAVVAPDVDALMGMDLDGIVISTPNNLHAPQSLLALERDMAVFCQKPLGCNESEVRAVVDAARRHDRLLTVDLTYRRSPALQEAKRLVDAGEIGDIYAADLVFHNAYGPDKTWFYDRTQSGGGCFLDLGVHLVDLGLWMLDFPRVENVTSRFFARGIPIKGSDVHTVEDHALARLDFENGAAVQVACSWHLATGNGDAVFRATLHGTKGALHVHNLNGTYFDLALERHTGREKETLVMPNGRWDSTTAIEWTRRLRESKRFLPEAARYAEIARVLDQVYAQ
jgi:predicted dehydrogenase